MLKRFICILLIGILGLAGMMSVACSGGTGSESKSPSAQTEEEGDFSQELQIIKSDIKPTQEQMLSRIKAEYLLENNGYRDDDEVVAIITLNGDAVIDEYLGNDKLASAMSLAEYAASSAGTVRTKVIDNAQTSLVSSLKNLGLINGVNYRYSTVLNAVSVTTTFGNFKKLSSAPGVSKVSLADTYNRPQSGTVEGAAVENNVDVYDTGIFNSSSVSYTGKGTAVAILDSGFDCSHEVFQRQPDTDDLLLTRTEISAALPSTNAIKTTADLKISDVYYSDKIPFVYDYADKDKDVFPYDSEHGTHVAGIIGGKSDVITGVAIDTQLVLMKVFSDHDQGAQTDDILAALEDAILLQVDCINMSLGAVCGFAREEDGSYINTVYDKINESGVSLLTAAGNEYSSGYGGEQGNTNFVTNPDSGVVGSPSTYAAPLAVASISGEKSHYLVANGSDVIFFNESSMINGKPNDFFEELGITKGVTKEYEYVTVPGYGSPINYRGLNIEGKIALVRRGSTTFEEKAIYAKNAGAAACIIYNNIDGDILMSLGKSDHIPTVSISMEDGNALAAAGTGTIVISGDNEAGPFMSDFSSWGPLPDLQMKPEITAHGGNIKSSTPGGKYDELSGTSMATPNLCGIVVLIRQFLKEQPRYSDYTWKQISVLANQMLMSTATIILNEEGMPYSPRKQGAGLASLYNVVNTDAYITVPGKDRSKIELYDDPTREGSYEMKFEVVNVTDSPVTYDLSLVGMTETVSTADDKHVAETDQLLGNDFTATVTGAGTYSDGKITVDGNGTLSVKLVYNLSAEDKNLIDSLFPYGMYVEGFVKLLPEKEGGIDLNVPFLAFYGDWTQAPLFDKTFYEVESEAHNGAIDEEDKLKADYYATTPMGKYFYNYIIPLGSYLYDLDEMAFDAIPATEEHIAISNSLGTIDGITAVYAGLLRNAKEMLYTITDKVTGETVYENLIYNARKAFSQGGSPIPNYEFLYIDAYELGLTNNRQYEFAMTAKLDYGDGGVANNVRNSFKFDFNFDIEAPILRNVTFEKIYDSTQRKDRFYINMTVYDNQYVMSVTPIAFVSSSSYTTITDTPIPVYSEKNSDNTVRFEITDYLENLPYDQLINSALGFLVDDYALNSNLYLCQLPGTNPGQSGLFSFTSNGKVGGGRITSLDINVGDVVDLTDYLATTDATLDADKDYLKYLVWESNNTRFVEIHEGVAVGKNPGSAVITVYEGYYGKQTSIIVRVRAAGEGQTDVDAATLRSVRFTYFDTQFAFARAAQTSEIGTTGTRNYITSFPGGVSFYPGESIKLNYDVEPWYVAGKYNFTYSSSNPDVAEVTQDGVVRGLKEGFTTIMLTVEGSYLMARLNVSIKNEFVIENRTLIAYKGLGGRVEIPDDEGILYIGDYAFCLYTTDNTIEITDDDYDKNKLPDGNTTVTDVIIPEGVEQIQKYAFYNCINLRTVQVPESCRFIQEHAFDNCYNLQKINLENIEAIGENTFYGCVRLDNIDLTSCYAIANSGFEGCMSLTSVDLSGLRNAGQSAFRGCSSLTDVTFTKDTKLAPHMFEGAGLTEVNILTDMFVPDYAFAGCENLTSVTIKENIVSIGEGAFAQCPVLQTVDIQGSVDSIGMAAFWMCDSLETVTLPNCNFTVGESAFEDCPALTTLVFGANTHIDGVYGNVFVGCPITTFDVSDSDVYTVSDDGKYLVEGAKLVFAAIGSLSGDITVEGYDEIGVSAFAGAPVESVTITGDNVKIGDYAFADCETLASVTLPESGVTIGVRAFNACPSLTSVENLENVEEIGDYAFSRTGLTDVTIAANATLGEGAFFNSPLQTLTLGANVVAGMGAFQRCTDLTTVNMPEEGGVSFGESCFSYDVSLTTIDLSKTDGIIAAEAFFTTGLVSVDLGGVTEIGNAAFADCDFLTNVNNTDSLVSIGALAFAAYSETAAGPQFTTFHFPETLVSIGNYAFNSCARLGSVTLPESLESLGMGAFEFCTALTTVHLPESLETVPTEAFAGDVMLGEVNLENVKHIGDFAFTSAQALASIDLTSCEDVGYGAFADTSVGGDIVANNLVFVDDLAFQMTAFTSFAAPKLAYIGEQAFHGNGLLREFTFSDDIAHVGVLAFGECARLASYSFGADKSTDGKINDYAFLVDGVLYTVAENGRNVLNSVPGGLRTDTLEVVEGTYRIELYAGNFNSSIAHIILPDSLEYIGDYAFYAYSALRSVEFRSAKAPVLESHYNNQVAVPETAPGYKLVHAYPGLFGLELCYFNFVDMMGARNPITMILPANEELSGYDALAYETYFGTVASAQRSKFVAKELNFRTFLENYEKIAAIEILSMDDESIVDAAMTAYNAMTQDPTDFGYTEEEWNAMVATVTQAKADILRLKVANASKAVRDVQAMIDALPDYYDGSAEHDRLIDETEAAIASLKRDDRSLLIQDKYEQFRSTRDLLANVAAVQELIDKLPDYYDGSDIQRAMYEEVTSAINDLGVYADRLDIAKYEKFAESYLSFKPSTHKLFSCGGSIEDSASTLLMVIVAAVSFGVASAIFMKQRQNNK